MLLPSDSVAGSDGERRGALCPRMPHVQLEQSRAPRLALGDVLCMARCARKAPCICPAARVVPRCAEHAGDSAAAPASAPGMVQTPPGKGERGQAVTAPMPCGVATA